VRSRFPQNCVWTLGRDHASRRSAMRAQTTNHSHPRPDPTAVELAGASATFTLLILLFILIVISCDRKIKRKILIMDGEGLNSR